MQNLYKIKISIRKDIFYCPRKIILTILFEVIWNCEYKYSEGEVIMGAVYVKCKLLINDMWVKSKKGP